MLLSSLVGPDVCMGLPGKPFKGRVESGHYEGSWAAFQRWRDLLEKLWWRSGEFLGCISHLVYVDTYTCMCVCIYIDISVSWYVSHICAYGTYIWCKSLALRDFFTQKMAHTTKEDSSVLSWARAVLASLNAVRIHLPIFTFRPTWGNMTQTV